MCLFTILKMLNFLSFTQLNYNIHQLNMVIQTAYMSHLVTKPTKWHVRPAKTQISLGIRPVSPESSLSAWRKRRSLATHWAHSEDSDQTGRMPGLIWVFFGRTLILLVLSWGGSNYLVCFLLSHKLDAHLVVNMFFVHFPIYMSRVNVEKKKKKCRCSTHRLSIEKGRYSRNSDKLQFCHMNLNYYAFCSAINYVYKAIMIHAFLYRK